MLKNSALPPGIYAITDEALLPGELLAARVTAALATGISVLQYRNKGASWAERLAEGLLLKTLCDEHKTPLLINDDIDLCLATGAAGVHLGQGDASLRAARSRLGQHAVIGITCHSDLRLAQMAEQQGASYVAFGRFFPSRTKPHALPASIDVLRHARRSLAIPIVAIGGINAENGAALLDAGADMLAVIHHLFAFPDVSARVRQLNTLFTSSSAT